MAGNDPFVAEENARDATRKGLLWADRVFGAQEFRTSAGLILTAATVPSVVVSSGCFFARWVAGQDAALTFTMDIPGDYNEVVDKLHLRLKVWKSTAGDAAGTIAGSSIIVRDGAAIGGQVDLSSQVISDATTPSILDINYSGSGFKGKDSVTFIVDPAAHATAVIDVYGGCLRYIGGTSLYNETDRYAT